MTDTTETTTAPRVWVGCLGCYNAGALVGAWVDAIDAADFDAHAAGMGPAGFTVPACGRTVADEPWVFDLEGFGGFLAGECSPSEAAGIAGTMAEIEADGYDVEAVGAWLEWSGHDRLGEGGWEPARTDFEDAYQGTYESGADYAERSFEDMGGWDMLEPGGYGHERADLSSRWPFYCIDWERAWRELELGDGMHITGEGYVFRSV